MSRFEHLARRWRHEPGASGEVVILDNRDSFVFNLAHRFAEVGARPVVARSDEVSPSQVLSWQPRAIVLSPGPGHPREAGCSIELLEQLAGENIALPVLGVCLGHQAIGVAFGGTVSASGAPRHGKPSNIDHTGEGIFEGVPSPQVVGRYHSLVIEEPLPPTLEATAWCDGFVMGVRHRTLPIVGVQFHPESVLTPTGKTLLANFLRLGAPGLTRLC